MNSKPLNILLIDDDEVDRRLCCRMIEDSDLHVNLESIQNPKALSEYDSLNDIDCILMDYRYPSGYAFDIFNDLLKQTCSERPPIIIMTGQGSEGVAAESIKRGAQEYLSKKNMSSALVQIAIESALEKSNLQKEISRRDQDLVKLSFYDSLTNLPNRRLFFDRLQQAMLDAVRADRKFAVLMMDLNLFKLVNDNYGHEIGDKLLVEVARRLQQHMRDSDTIARLGGDEFAAILSSTEHVEGAQVVANKIEQALREPFLIDTNLIQIGTSIGISIFPEHGELSQALLKHADLAMYNGKKNNRGITIYKPDFARNIASEEQLDNNAVKTILSGLNKHQFQAYFQPQLNLLDNTVIGFETLARWENPQLGLLPASRFIPGLECTEHIACLTLHMLEKTLIKLNALHQDGYMLKASVNLSARVLDSASVIEKIRNLIDRYQVNPEYVCFEVTETGIMHSPAMAEMALNELKNYGVRISIDDFGTGYSSLKYLRNFPIDEIKIDGLFVSNLDKNSRDSIIVESILALGKAFDVQVLAEGIEQESSLKVLQSLGCQYGQGYLFSEAMSDNAFTDWLAAEKTRIQGVTQTVCQFPEKQTA